MPEHTAAQIITMINPPKGEIRATHKKELYKYNDNIVIDNARIADIKTTKLQIWGYDPKLVSKDKIVDIVSLALSLDNIKDERVEKAIEDMMKDKKWYMG